MHCYLLGAQGLSLQSNLRKGIVLIQTFQCKNAAVIKTSDLQKDGKQAAHYLRATRKAHKYGGGDFSGAQKIEGRRSKETELLNHSNQNNNKNNAYPKP